MDVSSPVTGAHATQDATRTRGSGKMSSLSVMRLLFTVFWVAAFAYAALASRDFSANSGVFPGIIALIGLVIALATLVMAVRTARQDRAAPAAAPHVPAPDSGEVNPMGDGSQEGPPQFGRAARYGGWLAGFVLAIWLVGAVIAGAVFVAAFLAIEAHANWKWLIAGPALIVVGLVGLANAINLYWPETLLRL